MSITLPSLFAALSLSTLGSPSDAPTGLEALAHFDELPLFRDGVCRQFSSYDRSGGNADAGHFLAERDGVFTLADVRGPGCIYRIWSANPSGTFRLFLNGEPRPRLECPFADLFQGKVPPFAPPLAGVSSGGHTSLVPIPFSRSCRIEVAGGEGFYYQVTYHQLPAMRDVPTFDPKISPEDLVLLDRAQAIEKRLGEPPFANDAKVVSRVERKDGSLAPGERTVLAALNGPAEVRAIRLAIEPRHRDVLRGAALRVFWDDEKEPSVEAPIADFFGCGFGDRRFQALPIGMTDAGCYCYFPMPFARAARIEISNDSPLPIASFHAEIEHRELQAPPRGSGRFHARWRRAATEPKKPYVLFEAKGRGHYVGCTMAMQGTSGLHFLEGDEQVFVDGEKEPSIIGTGTEDFFNGGWYFNTGEFALGLHGVPLKDEAASRIAAYRFQIGDCIPFKKSIRFQIEHGGVNDYPGADYSSVAYWYQEEPHEPWPPMPAFDGRRLLSPRVSGAVEAENEQPLGAPAPVVATDVSLPCEASGGRFLRIVKGGDAAPGMGFPAMESGIYEVRFGIVPLGNARGRCAVSVDGKRLEATLDLHGAPSDRRSEASAGFVRLERGRHGLTFEADPEAEGAFGLDYVRLVPPLRERGVLEAEALEARASPDSRRVEPELGTLRWSGGGQLRLHAEAPGDALVFEVVTAEDAIYAIEACVTRGPSYGRFVASLDGGPPGAPIDAGAGSLERGPWVSLVRGATLSSGPHRLRLEVEGSSGKGLDIGIDCLRLRKSFDPGALEAERLRVVESSGGPADVQEMAGFGRGWSGDAQLFFRPTAPGAFVAFEVTVEETGTFEIAARFTRAADYGRVQASIDGRPFGKIFDGFNRGVTPSGRVVLGSEYVRKGSHTLRFTVQGKDDASTGFFVGIDCVSLTKKF